MSTVEHIDEPSATSVTESATSLTESATSVTESATSLTESATSLTESASFIYEKDGVDLTEYALDFVISENDYNNLISSYTTENLVALFICVDGLVTCGGYHHSNGELREYFRNNEPSEKNFNSIREWYNDYYGESVTINKVLNNVFIGEDLVPLWKVLVDAKNEDNSEDELEADKEDEVATINNHTDLINPISITLSLFTFIIGIGFLTLLYTIVDM